MQQWALQAAGPCLLDAQSKRIGDETVCCAPVVAVLPTACVKLALLGSHKPCKAGLGLSAGPAMQKCSSPAQDVYFNSETSFLR